jgi:hypothetical protein
MAPILRVLLRQVSSGLTTACAVLHGLNSSYVNMLYMVEDVAVKCCVYTPYLISIRSVASTIFRRKGNFP